MSFLLSLKPQHQGVPDRQLETLFWKLKKYKTALHAKEETCSPRGWVCNPLSQSIISRLDGHTAALPTIA